MERHFNLLTPTTNLPTPTPKLLAIAPKPLAPPKTDERGAGGIIAVVIITPIFLGILILAFVASSTTQTDNNLTSAAQNAAVSAALCCTSAYEAAVVAQNVATSYLLDNSLPCTNFTSTADINDSEFVTVNFTDPPKEDDNDPSKPDTYTITGTVSNPRRFTPTELRTLLRGALRPGGLIQVIISCDLPLEEITGFWIPFRNQTTRTGEFRAVIDPAILVEE